MFGSYFASWFDVNSGEDFIDEQLENHQKEDGSWGNSTWFTHRKLELKQLNPLINLPFLIDGDLVQFSRTITCPMFMGIDVRHTRW
jgi:hypothetical protein